MRYSTRRFPLRCGIFTATHFLACVASRYSCVAIRCVALRYRWKMAFSVQNTSCGLERGIAALVPISRYDNNKRGWRNRIRSSGTNPVKTTVRETDIVANNVTCFY